MARQQKIEDVMTEQVCCIGEDASLREVARMMRDRKIGDVLVTDAAGKLCGIVTDRDIVVRALADGAELDRLCAKDVCTAEIATLASSAGVDEAIEMMAQKAIRRIPIVDGDRPIGIVSIGDLAVRHDPGSALGQISAAQPNN